MKKINISKVLASYTDTSVLKVIFYGEELSLLYYLYSFKEVSTPQIEKINNYECVKYFNKNISIIDIRENENLDNYFILLSNSDIIHINVIDIGGTIMQVLTIHTKNEPYYENVFEWYQESEVLF